MNRLKVFNRCFSIKTMLVLMPELNKIIKINYILQFIQFWILTYCTWLLSWWQSRKLLMAWHTSFHSVVACHILYVLVTSPENRPLDENMLGHSGYRPKRTPAEFKPHAAILPHCLWFCRGILVFSNECAFECDIIVIAQQRYIFYCCRLAEQRCNLLH